MFIMVFILEVQNFKMYTVESALQSTEQLCIVLVFFFGYHESDVVGNCQSEKKICPGDYELPGICSKYG